MNALVRAAHWATSDITGWKFTAALVIGLSWLIFLLVTAWIPR